MTTHGGGAAAWGDFIDPKKPLTIDLLPSSDDGTPTATAIVSLADNYGFGLQQPADQAIAFAGGGHGSGGGGGGGPLSIHYGGGALQFEITYESSVTGSKSASKIEADFASAISYFTNNFTPLANATSGPVTIALHVGWGDVAGLALPSGALGASFTNLQQVGYAGFANSLNQLGRVTSVPTNSDGDPLTSLGLTHNYVIATAEAKAIGLSLGGTVNPIDGWVGFSKTAQWYFDSGRQGITQYDFLGVAEHEISEAMGRIAQVGTTAYLNGDTSGNSTVDNAYTPFDLFRFDDFGGRSLVGGDAAHFSTNGGDNLGTFNTAAGDVGDWAVPGTSEIKIPGPNDAYDAGSYAGVLYAASDNDTTVVKALGFGTV